MLGWFWHQSPFWTTPGLLSLQVLLIANLILLRCNSRWEPALSLKTVHFPWLQQPLPWCGAAPQSKQGWRGAWFRLGMSCGGHRTLSRIKGSSIFSLCLVSGKSEPVCVLPQHSLCSSSPAVSPTGFHIS